MKAHTQAVQHQIIACHCSSAFRGMAAKLAESLPTMSLAVHSCAIIVAGIAVKPPPRDVLPAHVYQCQAHLPAMRSVVRTKCPHGRVLKSTYCLHRQHTVASGGDIGWATTDASLFSLALRLWLPAWDTSSHEPTTDAACLQHEPDQQSASAVLKGHKRYIQKEPRQQLTIRGGARQSRTAAGLVARVPHRQARRQLQFIQTSSAALQAPGAARLWSTSRLQHQHPMLRQAAARLTRDAASSGICPRTFAGRV
jgi:hypothetical protein